MRKVGIIGVGPRGGYALERLIIELAQQDSLSNIHISLFEATGNFGNGKVYDLDQNTSNWINITERVLELEERKAITTKILKIDSFPSYHQWINKDFSTHSDNEIDTYPPRAKIGKFLSERFLSLIEPLLKNKIVSLHRQRVTKVEWIDNNELKIITESDNYKTFDEILLTIGHQTTELSKQANKWNKYTCENKDIIFFKSPYPTYNYLNHKNLNSNTTIGIRGFGLAMIDVVRAIAEKFGEFSFNQKNEIYTYTSSYEIKHMFVPFSLDGLPPVPKPLNERIDNWFKPCEKSLINFEKKISNTEVHRKAKNYDFLTTAFAPIAANIFFNLPNANKAQDISQKQLEKLIIHWLQNQRLEHILITSSCQSVEKNMQSFVAMASGKALINLDYCIGQVWRHCQPSIYKSLSFNQCSDEVFAQIIALDESTKRYSFGPPVESIEKMLALFKADILRLDMVNNPNIELTKKGWKFEHLDKSITTKIMIDSVLDSPKIKQVSSSLVQNMLDDGFIKVVQDDLGVSTNQNGYLISSNKNQKIPIALLGRLAKGTIIGVDAILECFGVRPKQWAKQAAQNHINWLHKN